MGLFLLLACALSAADQMWIADIENTWARVSSEALLLESSVKPRIIYFDEKCVWDGKGKKHEGEITLPDGQKIPARLMTFAATFGTPPQPYLVMAMPSIWRATPRHAKDANLDQVMRAVFVHEMTHTQQTAALGDRITELGNALGIPDDEMSDDIVQQRFGNDDAFRAAWETERDLFFQAAREKDRAIARRALSAMKARRARFFRGKNKPFAGLEEIFLMMEGVANWAAYKASGDDLERMRGSRKWWSQDEGLAIFLTIDALLPGWQRRVFAEKPASLLALLEDAAK
jgi:hypothetical protein